MGASRLPARGGHWISRSARTRIDCAILMSSALAVLRFGTMRKVVGSSTGRSAGLAPRRILQHLCNRSLVARFVPVGAGKHILDGAAFHPPQFGHFLPERDDAIVGNFRARRHRDRHAAQARRLRMRSGCGKHGRGRKQQVPSFHGIPFNCNDYPYAQGSEGRLPGQS